ncbi:ketosteroid isomerase [Synechococcales cyanobacterium C]|uniref:Ketosteroid isomerase n=1 Tax=Petrachloros mirabilis ULC683 TaxID=2781853 RepID=A0A8K2AGU5_9CYAN|nr:nuclear transport factor 2 family protein [Petrachloros mirabilis]NCJ05419.1 ketosteroid isomerase [Petrachloros mirabilis ULC683]
MPTPEFIQGTVDQYFKATQSDNRVEAMVACFAPDSVSYDPAEEPPLQGQDALRQYFGGIASLFATVALTPEFVAINGNQAAVKWCGQGISHTGRTVTFEGIDLFEINTAGKIQSLRAYWNPAALLAELQR